MAQSGNRVHTSRSRGKINEEFLNYIKKNEILNHLHENNVVEVDNSGKIGKL